MRLMITIALTTALLAGCASTAPHNASEPAAATRDGSSLASAIVINARDEATGVRAEYQWIADRYPGYSRGGQALLKDSGHSYDAIDITTASGEHKKFYFDITNFFGKM